MSWSRFNNLKVYAFLLSPYVLCYRLLFTSFLVEVLRYWCRLVLLLGVVAVYQADIKWQGEILGHGHSLGGGGFNRPGDDIDRVYAIDSTTFSHVILPR